MKIGTIITCKIMNEKKQTPLHSIVIVASAASWELPISRVYNSWFSRLYTVITTAQPWELSYDALIFDVIVICEGNFVRKLKW